MKIEEDREKRLKSKERGARESNMEKYDYNLLYTWMQLSKQLHILHMRGSSKHKL